MNELTQRMWKQSTGSNWPKNGKLTAGEYSDHLQKFVEMIVKECAAIAWFAEQHGVGGDRPASTQIKDQFNVK